MNGKWIYYVLIFSTAIQQIVGGVSCCCFISVVAGSSQQSQIVREAQSAAGQLPTKPKCGKCKQNTNRITLQRPSQGLERFSGTICDCQAGNLDSVSEDRVNAYVKGMSKHARVIGWLVSAHGLPDEFLSVRFFQNSLAARECLLIVPAPNSLSKRLALFASWTI